MTGESVGRGRPNQLRRGLTVSADTIVPGAGNPQNLNRYAYVRNSPINLIDPTGHFEEEAIITYLTATYRDNWRRYYEAWKANTAWWEMLLAAQAGDVLFGVADASGRFRYQFNGAGRTELTGYTVLEGQEYDLDMVRTGVTARIGGGYDLNGSDYSVYSGIYWEGIYRPTARRPDDLFPFSKHDPQFYEPDDHDRANAGWVGAGGSALAGLGAGALCATGLGCIAVGLAVAAATYAGQSYLGFDTAVQDALDVEVGDLHATVGAFHFNFQIPSAWSSSTHMEWMRYER